MSYYKYPNGDILLLCSDAVPPKGYVQDPKKPFLYHQDGAPEWTPPVTDSKPLQEAEIKSKGPTRLTLLRIITGAFSAFTSYVKSGGKRTPSEIAKARLDACKKCDERIELLNYTVCGVCWCCMDVKTKIPSQECPIGIWGKISDEGKLPCVKMRAAPNKTAQ